MGKKYLFSTDDNGRTREVKVDPKHVDRQMRNERAAGRDPILLDEDERIQAGLNAAWIAEQHRKGRI